MPLRPEAPEAVEQLHAMGLETDILSGDSAPAVDAIASRLHIDRPLSGLSPADKLATLQAWQAADDTS